MGNTKCPVCETSMALQTDFCPTCGFQRHILPNGVSDKVQADENERIAKAQEFYKLYEAAKSAADNAKAAADKEMQSKLDEANEALAKEQTAHKKTKTALENEKTDHEETKTALKNEKKAHEKTESDLEDALKDEKKAHERTKSNLAKEQTAHNRTKDALKDEEAAHEETKSNLEDALKDEQEAHKETKSNLEDALKKEQDAHMQTKKKLDDAIKNPPTPPRPVPTPPPGPNKKVIGKALFTQGGRSETVDLYEGGCRVTAPAWTNIRGELFEILCDNGMYFLRDLSDSMYNRHERKISRLVTVSNRDAFRIGELIIRLSFPKQ